MHGPQAAAIEGRCVDAAHRMSTLDVRSGALRAAVASFPVVREVHASAELSSRAAHPRGRAPPWPRCGRGDVRTAVAADGMVLGPALLSGSLPDAERVVAAAVRGSA